MFLNKSTIFQKTCPIPLDIAFFQIFYKLTWKNGTFKTVRQLFFFYAVLYPAFSTMLRLSHIAVQTSRTWLFMVTMFVTNLTVHSAWSEHGMINICLLYTSLLLRSPAHKNRPRTRLLNLRLPRRPLQHRQRLLLRPKRRLRQNRRKRNRPQRQPLPRRR